MTNANVTSILPLGLSQWTQLVEVEFPACNEVWDASCGFSFVHQHIVVWQQLSKGCPLVQIYEHGDGKQEHLLHHSGHLLCRHNKGLLGREMYRGSLSPSREGCRSLRCVV